MSQPEPRILLRDEDGPFVHVATFCEKVLHEQDGVFSLVRMVDRVIGTPLAPNAPEKMPVLRWQAVLFIGLKSGFVRGSYRINVRMASPSGRQRDIASFPALFEGEDRGVNIVVESVVDFEEEGLYWFSVFFGDRFLTRVPLRVLYQRVGTPSPA